jgi:hypothetical protein
MKRIPLILLILAQLLILGTALYITGHAYKDLAAAVRQQAVNDQYTYLHNVVQHMNTVHNEQWTPEMIEDNLISSKERPSSFFLARFDSAGEFPIIWNRTTRDLEKYAELGSIRAMRDAVKPRLRNPEIVDEIWKQQLSLEESGSKVYRMEGMDGKRNFLVVWTIVPAPSMERGRYLFACLIEESAVTAALDSYGEKYTILFILGIVGVLGVAVLLPLELQNK